MARHAWQLLESKGVKQGREDVELSMMADGLDWCINTNPEVRLITSEEAHPGDIGEQTLRVLGLSRLSGLPDDVESGPRWYTARTPATLTVDGQPTRGILDRGYPKAIDPEEIRRTQATWEPRIPGLTKEPNERGRERGDREGIVYFRCVLCCSLPVS